MSPFLGRSFERSLRMLSQARRAVAVTALPMMLIGCANQRNTTFQIIDYREPGEAHRYQESFDEAYYTMDEHGHVNVVLQRTTPSQSNPGHRVRQVIHLRSVWRSIPGATVAERTQINGTVSYYILTGQAGAGFEGAGSLFFNEDRKTGQLSGSLDLAVLRPTRRLAASHDLFLRAELTGEFHASRDPRRVSRIVHEMNRMFGPPDAG